MVPAHSHKIPRASWYSGSCLLNSPFAYGAFTLSGRSFQDRSARLIEWILQSEPRSARTPVWAPPFSLAATYGIDFSFFSSGYLDVSVHRVPSVWLWIHHTVTEVCSAGFPHSDICGSMDICSSPQLFAAYHVFLRLLVPRHPPCALYSLTCFQAFVCSIPFTAGLTPECMPLNSLLVLRLVCIALHSSLGFLINCFVFHLAAYAATWPRMSLFLSRRKGFSSLASRLILEIIIQYSVFKVHS